MFLPYSLGALMTTYDAEFEENIRDLLSNLYDYLKLADNPVAEALAPESRGNERPAAIRRLVLGAIDEMQAEGKAGPVSRRNRLYHILQLRYVEQQSTVDVLRQLALSERQYYREHQRAIQTISRVIWDEHFASQVPAATTLSLADELDYLNVDRGQRAFDVRSEIHAAIKATRVIAQRRRIDINVIDDSAPISLSLSQPVFRQFIVLLLSELLLALARGARIDIGLQPGPEALVIRFGGLASAAQARQCCARLQGDATARALLASLKAELDCDEAPPQVVLRLQQTLRKILVVDDNPDAIGLFKRYLAKQPYQLLSAQRRGRGPANRGVDAAARHHPGCHAARQRRLADLAALQEPPGDGRDPDPDLLGAGDGGAGPVAGRGRLFEEAAVAGRTSGAAERLAVSAARFRVEI